MNPPYEDDDTATAAATTNNEAAASNNEATVPRSMDKSTWMKKRTLRIYTIVFAVTYFGSSRIVEKSRVSHHDRRKAAPSASTSFLISPLPSDMVLVHLGKTAGSSLSGNLRHGCHMFVPHPCRRSEQKNYGTKGGPGEESRISQLTKGYYHFNTVPVDKHDGYIISSRNPIDRVVSAFHYVHPKNVAFTTNHRAQFLKRNKGKSNPFVEEYYNFFKCFPNMTTLALSAFNSTMMGDGDGRIGEGNNNNLECATLARFILNGGDESTMKSEMLNHFAFGFKFYASSLLAAGSSSRIFVLRQEHLATDWINFNIRLGGEPHEMSVTRTKSFDKDKLTVKLPPGGLSKNERRGLCMLLAEEIEVYLGIIDVADNLTEEEKEESRQEIRDDCTKGLKHEKKKHLGCSEISNLLPLRVLGEGKQKVVYEVKLPSGEHAVAKRCKTRSCENNSRVKREATYLKYLQDQYGDEEALRFFGECDGGFHGMKESDANYNKFHSDWTYHYTSVVELARPLLASWDFPRQEIFQECFANHFTNEDLNGFKMIAEQYARFSPHPITFGHPTSKNGQDRAGVDNRFFQQYAVAKAGIRHIDLDTLYICKECSYEDALDFNCKIISKLTQNHISRNCTILGGENSQEVGHINSTDVVAQCIPQANEYNY